MQGHLLKKGIKITRKQLRALIHRVDHENTVTRRANVVRRRVYTVSHPNAMWHIDGHHKLIKWRFVIHAGVDGFSRTIVYIKCATNNRAVTAFSSFLEGVAMFGVADCVRTDHGGENIDIWQYMISEHNGDTSCVITDSSVHNERVERLWRDVHRCIASTFADLFHSLESEGYLDPLNEVDLFCLHHIFLPRINRSILEFRESWNQHKLSTEVNRTPYQLFLEGMLYTPSDNSSSEPVLDDRNLSEVVGNHVQVPCNVFSPCQVLLNFISLIGVTRLQ